MLASMAFGDLRLQVLVGTRLQFAFAAPVEQPRKQVARLIKPVEIMRRMLNDEQVVLILNAAVLRCGRSISDAGYRYSGSAFARFSPSDPGNPR